MSAAHQPPLRPSANTNLDPAREWIAGVWRYKWAIPAVTVVVAAAVGLVVNERPREYEATTTIQYDPHPAKPLGDAVDDPLEGSWNTYEFYQTQNLLLRSRTLAERIARKYGLGEQRGAGGEASEQSVAHAAQRLLEQLSISQVPDTSLVRIAVRDTDPDRAQLLANAVAEEYIDKSVEDRAGSGQRALEWLSSQMGSLRDDVDRAELALYKYREEHEKLSASLVERQKIIAAQLSNYSSNLTEVRTRRIRAEAHLAVLREFVMDESRPILQRAAPFVGDVAVAAMVDAIGAANTELQRLSVTYGEAHPNVRTVAVELDTVTQRLEQHMQSALASIEAELSELSRAQTGLERALAETNQQGLELSQEEAEYVRLERDRESKIKLYELLMERAAQTDLQQAIHVAQARIVDRALRPSLPVAPNVQRAVLLAALFGLALGFLVAFGLSQLDNKVRGLADLEGRGVTILGVLPAVESSNALRADRKRARRHRDGAPSTVDLIVHQKPRSTIAECCRTVRTNITFQTADRPIRALAITSAQPRDGKTTVSISLATTFAQSGKRVLLIDTDLRKPRLHRALGASAGSGLTSVLAGEATASESIRATEVPNLWLLPCGPIPPNPSELLHTRRFADVLAELGRAYDILVLDTPPLGAVTDPAIISNIVDGTILVVRARATARVGVDAALRQLGDVKARLLGAVVNDLDLSDSSYGPYYAYRGYYGEDHPPAEGDESAAGLSTP